MLAAATIASASKPATARPASKKRTRDSNSTNDDGGSGDDIADGAKAKSGAKANPSAKPSASAKVKAMVVKKQRILKVGMNPLATLHLDPLVVRCAFVFGEGGFGQHGLGPDRTDEIKKPRLHSGFEKMISEGDAWSMGVARVATGGMHTLAIDGQGRVSPSIIMNCLLPAVVCSSYTNSCMLTRTYNHSVSRPGLFLGVSQDHSLATYCSAKILKGM